MRFKTRARTPIRMGGVVAAATLVAVATSSITTASADVPVVKISVASLIPGSTAAATAAFNSQVKQFENANPGIEVTSVQYQWLGSTFAAKLAAGTLPTVFTVPFTDGRSLGDNGQLANLTPYFPIPEFWYFIEWLSGRRPGHATIRGPAVVWMAVGGEP